MKAIIENLKDNIAFFWGYRSIFNKNNSYFLVLGRFKVKKLLFFGMSVDFRNKI